MVPKVAGKGRSFMGAGQYYLHDKKADTRERVAFTHTVNLPTNDPDKAIRLMAYTAMHQSEIKARAGGSTRGRKLADPVYCYSLSWAPGEDPSQEDMIGAARETLKKLGLEGHEALLVGHNDEPHPHIHVIVNRVNPETGIAAPLKMDHLKLSTWAENYEQKQGQIRCDQRVENNRRRDAGEYVKYDEHARAEAFAAWRRDRANETFKQRRDEARDQFKAQAGERKQLSRETKDRIAVAQATVREQYRPDWRELYARQRKEAANLKKLQQRSAEKLRQATRGGDVDRTGERAVRQLLSARNAQPVPGPLRAPKGRRASQQEKAQARSLKGPLPDAFTKIDLLRAEKENRSGYLREAFELSTTWAIELADRHKKERAALSEDHRNKVGVEIRKVKNEADAQRDMLSQKQKNESQALTKRHLEERRQADLAKHEGRDKEQFQDVMRRKRKAAFDLTKEDIERKPEGLAKTARSGESKKQAKELREGSDKEFDRKEDITDAKREGIQPKGQGRPRTPTLSERFTRTSQRKENQASRSLGDDKAKAVTEQKEKPSERSGSLTEKFGKAQERNAAPERQDRKRSEFKDNANDVSRDQGRERSRTIKPPGKKD